MKALMFWLLAGPAMAGMSAAEFDAAVTGKTIHYDRFGEYAGSEQYLADRRARWMLPDGSCEEGEWHGRDGLICFEYAPDYVTQCWVVERVDGRLMAWEEGEPDWTAFVARAEDDEPLPCPGPDMGM